MMMWAWATPSSIIHRPVSIAALLCKDSLGLAPSAKLHDGLARTYAWIEQQVKARAEAMAGK